MLNLYKGNQPNLGCQAYYFDNFENYLTRLSNNLVAQIEKTNYILDNDLFLRLKGDYNDITYVVDTDTQKCYYVESIEDLSGYKRFNLSIDYWGSYIAKAQFESGIINEASFDLPIARGIWIKNQTPVGKPTYITMPGITFDKEKRIFLAMNIEYSYSKSSLFTNENITSNRLFGIYTTLENLEKDAFNYCNIFEMTKKNTAGVIEFSIPCGVNKMWAIPVADATPINVTYSGINFNYNYIDTTGLGLSSIQSGEVQLAYINQGDYFTDGVYSVASQGLNVFNKKFYFGAKNNYLPVTINSEANINTRYELRVGGDDINILVWFNEQNLDITSSFELSTTTNSGTFTQQQKIVYALKNLFNLSGGIISTIKGISSGDIGTTAHGISQTTNTLVNFGAQQSGQRNYTGGDGFYCWSTAQNQPLCLIRYDTIEQYSPDYDSGYNYSVYVRSANSLLKTGYIKAEFNVLGIPLNASLYIEGRLKSGVRLLKV